MLDHHLQRAIVYRLAFSPSLRFSELQPDGVENKLFSYHLKKVVAAGYVSKTSAGQYTLTSEGRRLGIGVLAKPQALMDRAESVLFLVIRRSSDDAWLLYRRKTHPLLGRTGFMHCNPIATETVATTAARCCFEKTGLKADFKVLGEGYFRVFDGPELESFTHFTLLTCETATGELNQDDEFAEYYWEAKPDFGAGEMLPNMMVLAKAYERGKPFFIEERLTA